ncbi:isochorismatase family cysteine hydrolase [Bacillus sp. B15-48]|uniref:cysteine hydrolase family protein n=1 Tax=Bacillus sp. B15-48 TaxID=1548601 RepID=UPI00193FF554|nr:isochorismatase family cysteine hydrolase [Bacillus sp. B15-48]MBM4764868.1 isochorismatase family protein [Bacillus sp. B15-48]
MDAYFNGIKKQLFDERYYDLFLDIKKTAVITIDMHLGHLSEDPDCPCPSPRAREIIEPINAFNDKCRQLGIPIIHVRSVLRKDGSDDIKGNISAWRLLFPETVGPIPGIDEHALEGTKWTEFGIDVKENDYIVDGKKRLSAFYPSDLELLLRNMRKETLILTGTMLDCCLLSTATEGANRDFRIVIPRDLARGYESNEEATLRIISMYFGLVVDSPDLLNQWRGTLAENQSSLKV